MRTTSVILATLAGLAPLRSSAATRRPKPVVANAAAALPYELPSLVAVRFNLRNQATGAPHPDPLSGQVLRPSMPLSDLSEIMREPGAEEDRAVLVHTSEVVGRIPVSLSDAELVSAHDLRLPLEPFLHGIGSTEAAPIAAKYAAEVAARTYSDQPKSANGREVAWAYETALAPVLAAHGADHVDRFGVVVMPMILPLSAIDRLTAIRDRAAASRAGLLGDRVWRLALKDGRELDLDVAHISLLGTFLASIMPEPTATRAFEPRELAAHALLTLARDRGQTVEALIAQLRGAR